jgi:N-acyl homoserine lactone hydrolase
MNIHDTVLASLTLMVFSGMASAQVDKLYVLDCGWSHNADESRWTPGLNVGKPIDMSGNCFLIHHASGYFLWETGYPDAVASMPDGQSSHGGATVVRRARTLAAQFQEIGVKPSDILYVGISHSTRTTQATSISSRTPPS